MILLINPVGVNQGCSGEQAPVCILRDKGLSTESAASSPVGRVRRSCRCRSGRLAGQVQAWAWGPDGRAGCPSMGFHRWPVYTAGRARLSGGLGSHCQPPQGSCPLLHFPLVSGQAASSHACWMRRDAPAGHAEMRSQPPPAPEGGAPRPPRSCSAVCCPGDPLPPPPTWHAPCDSDPVLSPTWDSQTRGPEREVKAVMCRTCIFHLDFIDSYDVYCFEFLFLCFYALCVVSSSAQLCLPFWDRMYCSLASPLSVGFSRQGYSSGLPFPSPGDLPNPGIKPWEFESPESPILAGRSFTIGATWEALGIYKMPRKPFSVWRWRWSRSVVSDSLRLHDCSLPGSSIHGIFQARVLE